VLPMHDHARLLARWKVIHIERACASSGPAQRAIAIRSRGQPRRPRYNAERSAIQTGAHGPPEQCGAATNRTVVVCAPSTSIQDDVRALCVCYSHPHARQRTGADVRGQRPLPGAPPGSRRGDAPGDSEQHAGHDASGHCPAWPQSRTRQPDGVSPSTVS
jgi:hypothetical protein